MERIGVNTIIIETILCYVYLDKNKKKTLELYSLKFNVVLKAIYICNLVEHETWTKGNNNFV